MVSKVYFYSSIRECITMPILAITTSMFDNKLLKTMKPREFLSMKLNWNNHAFRATLIIHLWTGPESICAYVIV